MIHNYNIRWLWHPDQKRHIRPNICYICEKDLRQEFHIWENNSFNISYPAQFTLQYRLMRLLLSQTQWSSSLSLAICRAIIISNICIYSNYTFGHPSNPHRVSESSLSAVGFLQVFGVVFPPYSTPPPVLQVAFILYSCGFTKHAHNYTF